MRKLPASSNIIHHYCPHYIPQHHQHHHPHLPFFPFPSPTRPTFRRRPPRGGVRMDCSSSSSAAPHDHHHQHHGAHKRKDKILVVMGATGCGKTRLSIDLATGFFPQSEIINSDKMQVYSGLDITTNKITLRDRRGVPHHLLGEVDPDAGEFFPSDFRLIGGLAISDIVSRNKLPIVVGGSNSFIHALVVDRFHPETDVFDPSAHRMVSTQLRYDCCFLWVDVSFPVLCDYLCKRVDEMLDSGMFVELSDFFRESGGLEAAGQVGLRKAIGVPEFDRYCKKYPPRRRGGARSDDDNDQERKGAYQEAVRQIKENTCQLAERQLGKIRKLKSEGWDLQIVDATEAFREAMRVTSGGEEEEEEGIFWGGIEKNSNWRRRKKKKKRRRWVEVWEREVVEPSVKIVSKFLEEE